MKLLALIITSFILLNFTVFARESIYVAETDSVYQNKILFLPVLGSKPETGFMFGAVVVSQFKLSGSGEETRSSSLLFPGIYTTKKQILMGLLSDINFPGERWILNGNYSANYLPGSYWGWDQIPEIVMRLQYFSLR